MSNIRGLFSTRLGRPDSSYKLKRPLTTRARPRDVKLQISDWSQIKGHHLLRRLCSVDTVSDDRVLDPLGNHNSAQQRHASNAEQIIGT